MCSDDAVQRAAGKVNKGLDRAQEKQEQAFENSATKEDVKEQSQKAADTAKETAIQAKCDECAILP
jgi:hypothetical protein